MLKPLAGYRIIEFAGLGAGPYAGMLLADLGAELIEINRTYPSNLGIPIPHQFDLLRRGRRSISVDLKTSIGIDIANKLIAKADALIDPFRPGVLERLGFGPSECSKKNPKLIFGRITGYGQTGPLAKQVGHDLNYIALAGVLGQIGSGNGPPTPPLNLVGDFGGGGMLLALGILAGLLQREKTERGTVVDAAMLEGAANQMTMFFGYQAAGILENERGRNILDGGAPFYRAYETKDHQWVAVAAIEDKFYADLLSVLDVDYTSLPNRWDRSSWPTITRIFQRSIAETALDELLLKSRKYNACLTPILDFNNVADYPQNLARRTFVDIQGITQPGPVPRFDGRQLDNPQPPPEPGADTEAILSELGFDSSSIKEMIEAGYVGYNHK